MEKILTFKVGHEKFCFDVFKIVGIDQKTKVSSIPLSPPHHIGMMNLRGQIIPVIDLRILFGATTDSNQKENCYIFVESNGFKMACLVDSVYEVVDCTKHVNAQSKVDLKYEKTKNFVDEVLNVQNDIVFLLNAESIYNSISFTATESVA